MFWQVNLSHAILELSELLCGNSAVVSVGLNPGSLAMHHMSNDDDRLLTAPILITGTPRSGKTLTATILSHADGLAYANEPLSVWAIGATSGSDDRRYSQEATTKTIKRIRSLCAKEVRRQGGRRYLDDLSYHALRFDFIRAVMPDALIIHVIQDGYVAIPQMVNGWTFTEPFYKTIGRRWRGLTPYTIVRTLPKLAKRWLINHWASKVEGRRRAWGPQPPGLAEFAQTHPDPAEIAAFQWRRINEVAMESVGLFPSEQVMTMRFEDLKADPVGMTAKLAAFCRIADVESVQCAARRILDPSVAKKGVNLTDDQWKAVERIAQPLRTQLGYDAELPKHRETER